jgi:hypothetical protein
MEFLSRTLEQLVGRTDGLFAMRFVFQPLVATILAIRAGVADARNRRTPYLSRMHSNPAERRALIREGFIDVIRVFLVALVLDVLYQVLVFQWLYPLQTLVVAFVLAIVPYALIRGLVTRTVRHFAARG